MKVVNSPIAGVFYVQPEVHEDERGEFAEFYRASKPELRFVQGNVSESVERVVRGIHYSPVSHGQYKYVTCVSGAAMDWQVDLRPGSKTFGMVRSINLDEAKRNAVQIPPGVGHAMCALIPGTVLMYLQTTEYDPAAERTMWPLDRTLNITFPYSRGALILSRRDSSAETFEHSEVWRAHHARN